MIARPYTHLHSCLRVCSLSVPMSCSSSSHPINKNQRVKRALRITFNLALSAETSSGTPDRWLRSLLGLSSGMWGSLHWVKTGNSTVEHSDHWQLSWAEFCLLVSFCLPFVSSGFAFSSVKWGLGRISKDIVRAKSNFITNAHHPRLSHVIPVLWDPTQIILRKDIMW